MHDDAVAQLVRDTHETTWKQNDLSVLPRRYDRGVNLHLPGGSAAYGRDQYASFLIGYLASFPDASFAIEHSIARHDPGRPVRVATRWRLTGTHQGTGAFGTASNAPLLILGITHTELVNERVVREWLMIDEMAIWRRIGHHLG